MTGPGIGISRGLDYHVHLGVDGYLWVFGDGHLALFDGLVRFGDLFGTSIGSWLIARQTECRAGLLAIHVAGNRDPHTGRPPDLVQHH